MKKKVAFFVMTLAVAAQIIIPSTSFAMTEKPQRRYDICQVTGDQHRYAYSDSVPTGREESTGAHTHNGRGCSIYSVWYKETGHCACGESKTRTFAITDHR